MLPCVQWLPYPSGQGWLIRGGASKGGWRPSASWAAPWVSSCRSESRSLTGWQHGHYLGYRSSQTLGDGPHKEREKNGKRRRWKYRGREREGTRLGKCKTKERTVWVTVEVLWKESVRWKENKIQARVRMRGGIWEKLLQISSRWQTVQHDSYIFPHLQHTKNTLT